ncbi:MAG: exodeoxyribonuclease VII large subunit [Betaproteobacteria bacterium]|nr:MAG: exodeoxyribonuclease VII large subunit [Betaproteobacteria bacterium]
MARDLLERALPLMWVRGEISNFTCAPSGHCYFTLKDAGAQVRCAMFRNRARLLDWQPQNGMQVEVRALVTLFEPRGEFQLNVEAVRRAGLGALYEAFERLKARLATEGLFEPARKRPIPAFPRAIGIVTSAKAAALRDVLSILARRMPLIPVIVYPSAVQGAGAGQSIADAITTASRRGECDVLLVCRGGGSIEDLWAFNEEAVARAIFACSMPVIAGVGHETDFTIADFVADLRAPTPSAAAEAASPDRRALIARLSEARRRLGRTVLRRLQALSQALDYFSRRLVDPRERLRADSRHLRHLALRMIAGAAQRVAAQRWLLTDIERRMSHARPDPGRQMAVLQQMRLRLEAARTHDMRDRSVRVAAAAARLEALNPHAVLERGYAIATDGRGRVVRDASRLTIGATLGVRLARGQVEAEVRSVCPEVTDSESAAGEPKR